MNTPITPGEALFNAINTTLPSAGKNTSGVAFSFGWEQIKAEGWADIWEQRAQAAIAAHLASISAEMPTKEEIEAHLERETGGWVADVTGDMVRSLLAERFAKLTAERDEARAELAQIKNELPDDLYADSKDWRRSNTVGRIQWLKGMFENRDQEVEIWVQQTTIAGEEKKKALAEVERLKQENTHLAEQRRCECSMEDACRFAKERDAMKQMVKQANHTELKSCE